MIVVTPTSMNRLLREQAANAFAIDLFADHIDHHPPFLVLEYCSGGSLTNWVFDRKPARTVATAMRHAMLGLQGIHGRGGFHGDFTPRNLLVAQYSDGWRVKLIDLGLGKTPNPLSGSMTRDFRGTPNYTAPEVEKGDDYTWRADIFSAGIVLRELLTGVRMKVAFRDLAAHRPRLGLDLTGRRLWFSGYARALKNNQSKTQRLPVPIA